MGSKKYQVIDIIENPPSDMNDNEIHSIVSSKTPGPGSSSIPSHTLNNRFFIEGFLDGVGTPSN